MNNENKNNVSVVASQEVTSVETKYVQVEFDELAKITWAIADLIRDKVDGDTRDYMEITLPFILTKRILDTREEHIDDYVKKSVSYELSEDLMESIKTEYDKTPVFKVQEDKLDWYCVTWDDIKDFVGQKDVIDREIKLKKYPEISITTNARNVQEFISQITETFSNETIHKIYEISKFSERIRDTKKLKNEHFLTMVNDITPYSFSNKCAPTDIFSDTYMYLIERFAEGAGKKGGEFFTPRTLCEGVVKILNPILKSTGMTKVADITAGSATFITETIEYFKKQIIKEKGCDDMVAMNDLNQRSKMFLQEKTGTTLILGEMNLLFKSMTSFIAYNANSITEYNDNIGNIHNLSEEDVAKGKCDYVVGNPPYGLKDYGLTDYFGDDAAKKKFNDKEKEDRWQFGIPPKGEGEYAFINTFIDMLNSNGRGAIVLPLGTLFKDSTKFIRKEYIEKGYVEGLVLLPDSMFATTGIPVVVWIINKDSNRENADKIFMINASQHFEKKGKFNVWNQPETISAYWDKTTEEGFSGWVSKEDILENDYNLSVQRYIFKDEPEEVIDIGKVFEEMTLLEQEYVEYKSQINPIVQQAIQIENSKKGNE